MKIVTFILASMVSFSAFGDCRLNEQDGNRKFHGPYSSNTDLETRTGNFKANSFPLDENGNGRFAYAFATVRYGCRNGWGPPELENLKVGESITIGPAIGNSGETCAYTDTDGNAYNAPDWTVKTQKIKEVPVKEPWGYGPQAWCYYKQTIHAIGITSVN